VDGQVYLPTAEKHPPLTALTEQSPIPCSELTIPHREVIVANNNLEAVAAALVGDVQSIKLGAAMLAGAFSNGEAINSLELLRNQLVSLQAQIDKTEVHAQSIVSRITTHNMMYHD